MLVYPLSSYHTLKNHTINYEKSLIDRKSDQISDSDTDSRKRPDVSDTDSSKRPDVFDTD